ncbi:ABC-F family ATP-binding cassette domain-containing protein [Reinekea marinisedimentorum]|uniref:Probable ATP-binding protein YheS n=1 Tax=Reinekea marinisedimentorum TaxID=230495 RepID=A0A4R3IB41_9GAMM|nr:ATP-binding cassette domain-containing protein [Reinekea marinisedimentorum]TCS43819.1 ATP-binding cassette subfamily F protein 3 [Reinekea marinisedimentorum]
MIKLSNISLQLGGKSLLEDASVTFNPGERIAVIGANGTGKSTLFRVLQGELSVDAGECLVPKQWRLSHMAQEVDAVDRSALAFVLDGDKTLRQLEAELEQAQQQGDDHIIAECLGALDNYQAFNKQHQAEQLLAGLGFTVEQFQNPVGSFSGGWRVRLNLARALMCPADLLLLDEPTNHLDLHTCYWLEGWLRQFEGTLLFISHDRDFMDGVATQVVGFDQKKLTLYRGNYSQFERQRSERLAQQQAAFENEQRQREHLESFVRRFKAKATKAKQAQSRVKMLEKLTLEAPAIMSHGYDLSISAGGRVSDPVISLHDVNLGYGDKTILHNLNLSLHPGTRLGLLGVNGAGKSTLIKALSKELTPQQGHIHYGQNIEVGYFAQHQLESLDDDASPFLHIRRIDPDARDQDIKNFIGRFGFSGDRALEPVINFSGGEKARVALAMIAWKKPNLLLLDEPTNHLDLDMRESLNLALQQYEGAVILVSHDRYLLNTTAEEFWWVRDGRVEDYHGDLADYFQALLKAPTQQSNPLASTATAVGDKKAQRQARAAERERLKPLLRQQKAAEQKMEKLQLKLDAIENELADPTIYETVNKAPLQKALLEQGEVKAALEAAELDWMEASEALEEMQSST